MVLILTIPYFIFISFEIKKIMKTILPDKAPIESLNSLLLYIFIMLFIFGLLMQKLHFKNFRQYLCLTIKKYKIIHFNLYKTIFSYKSLFIIALFTPLSFILIPEKYSIEAAVLWLLNNIFIIFSINLLIQLIKLYFQQDIKIAFILIIIFFSFAIFYKSTTLRLDIISKSIFYTCFNSYLFLFVTIIIFISLYLINYWVILNNLFLDNLKIPKKINKNYTIYKIINKFCDTNELIKFNFKQIFRNQRGWTSYLFSIGAGLIFSIFLYPKFLHAKLFWRSNIMLYIITLYFPSIFLVQHMNFFFAWDSCQIDFLYANKNNFSKYFYYRIVTVVLLISPLYILLYSLVIFKQNVIIIIISSFLFNIGCSSFLLIFLSVYNTKKIFINMTIFNNYQGQNFINYLSIYIISILPLVLIVLFRNKPQIAYIINGLFGIFGVLLSDKWLNFITEKYKERKYKILKELR